MDFGQTLAKHRKESKMNQQTLADELKKYGFQISAAGISAWEKNTNSPSARVFLCLCKILKITDIYDEFIGIRPDDAYSQLNEAGRQKALEYIRLLTLSEEYKRKESTVIPQKWREFKLFQLPVSAGTGEFLDSEDYEIIQVGAEVPDNADFGVRISGDSMMPRFVDGQMVCIEQTDVLLNGEIGIFYLNGNAYCKKLQSTNEGTYLISLNEKYKPIKVENEASLKTFGRVLC